MSAGLRYYPLAPLCVPSSPGPSLHSRLPLKVLPLPLVPSLVTSHVLRSPCMLLFFPLIAATSKPRLLSPHDLFPFCSLLSLSPGSSCPDFIFSPTVFFSSTPPHPRFPINHCCSSIIVWCSPFFPHAPLAFITPHSCPLPHPSSCTQITTLLVSFSPSSHPSFLASLHLSSAYYYKNYFSISVVFPRLSFPRDLPRPFMPGLVSSLSPASCYGPRLSLPSLY